MRDRISDFDVGDSKLCDVYSNVNDGDCSRAAAACCCFSGEKIISFAEAVAILRTELNYPEQRALHFVKMFDHNGDGQLSIQEFNQFKNKIEQTYVLF